jgi:hypothetical protein
MYTLSTLKHLDGNFQQYSCLLVSQGFEGKEVDSTVITLVATDVFNGCCAACL